MPHTPHHDERGASSAEYAIIVSLIAVAIILAVVFFGESVAGLFSDSGSSVADLP